MSDTQRSCESRSSLLTPSASNGFKWIPIILVNSRRFTGTAGPRGSVAFDLCPRPLRPWGAVCSDPRLRLGLCIPSTLGFGPCGLHPVVLLGPCGIHSVVLRTLRYTVFTGGYLIAHVGRRGGGRLGLLSLLPKPFIGRVLPFVILFYVVPRRPLHFMVFLVLPFLIFS